jgi:uncharacterized protein YndB with AHSA1/START domain
MKNPTTVERKSERELVVTRTFHAPAHIVFEAWTKPELLKRWWAPKSFGISFISCEADVRTGGTYRFVFSHAASEQPMAFFGRYIEVTPHSRIVWTNEESADGAVSTVTFEEKGRILSLKASPRRRNRLWNREGGRRAVRAAGHTSRHLGEIMRKPPLKPDAQGQTGTKLLVAMTGKASAAKAAEGDEPVFAYIASLPQPQRSIAERVDALAANTLPNLQRAVKWGMAYYGVGGGWCFSSGAFVGHVKLMFIRGTEIKPEPPVTPIGMGKSTRGVELASVDDLDEHQVASWMKQAAANPFVGGKKR